MQEKPEGVTDEVAEKIHSLQPRCIKCGSVYALHIHHRIFKSEGENHVTNFLAQKRDTSEDIYKRELPEWSLNCIQNLCVLCIDCHEGKGTGVHGGNEKLRQFLKNSFTCPHTGFNIKYEKEQSLF